MKGGADELARWAGEQMSAYKAPLIGVVGRFPLTDIGKIRKAELLDRVQRLVDAPIA